MKRGTHIQPLGTSLPISMFVTPYYQ